MIFEESKLLPAFIFEVVREEDVPEAIRRQHAHCLSPEILTMLEQRARLVLESAPPMPQGYGEMKQNYQARFGKYVREFEIQKRLRRLARVLEILKHNQGILDEEDRAEKLAKLRLELRRLKAVEESRERLDPNKSILIEATERVQSRWVEERAEEMASRDDDSAAWQLGTFTI